MNIRLRHYFFKFFPLLILEFFSLQIKKKRKEKTIKQNKTNIIIYHYH